MLDLLASPRLGLICRDLVNHLDVVAKVVQVMKLDVLAPRIQTSYPVPTAHSTLPLLQVLIIKVIVTDGRAAVLERAFLV